MRITKAEVFLIFVSAVAIILAVDIWIIKADTFQIIKDLLPLFIGYVIGYIASKDL